MATKWQGKSALWRFTNAPAFRFKCRGGAKNVALYEECYKAWYVGLIEDWHYGTRSDGDPTLVWTINGIEISKVTIPLKLRAALADAGIASLDWGETWCGYRSLIVTYTDGRRVVERYNGWATVVEEIAS